MHFFHSCIHYDLDTLAPYSTSHVMAFANFFDYQTVRGFFPQIWGFYPFFTTRLHGGNHPDDGNIFPSRKPILYTNIIMHLLHSYTHCDLDNSCSTLKSRDSRVIFI